MRKADKEIQPPLVGGHHSNGSSATHSKGKFKQVAAAKDRKRPLHPSPLVKTLADAQRRMSHTDVLGSWTGVPWEDADEEPVQDADDL